MTSNTDTYIISPHITHTHTYHILYTYTHTDTHTPDYENQQHSKQILKGRSVISLKNTEVDPLSYKYRTLGLIPDTTEEKGKGRRKGRRREEK